MKFDFCSSGDDPKCKMMQKCMSYCKWCPYIPLAVGVVLFLIGIILSATTIKVLWVLVSIAIVLFGVFCIMCKSNMEKTVEKKEPEESDTDKPE